MLEQLQENLEETYYEPLVITTFYRFFNIENPIGLQRKLLRFCKLINIKGTFLIASEGINATMAGKRKSIDLLYQYLEKLTNFTDIEFKETLAQFPPFEKLKIKIRPEIVTMGVENLDMFNNRGEYIEPKDWDNFISQDDVILIDTRNKYETRLGHFEGAIDPNTHNFREFPVWAEKNLNSLKEKKVAMYCTYGIRCEKSTAFLKQVGIKNVYHLKGGIGKYIEEKGKSSNHKWKGRCFIFDDRVTLDNNLESSIVNCKSCNNEISTQELKHIRSSGEIFCLKCIEN